MAGALRADGPGRALWGIAGVCLAAVGAALVAQYGFDMRPCPWCVLQRLVYLLIALAAVLGALASSRSSTGRRKAALGVVGLLAIAGVACVVYQHVIAAKQFSCSLSFADKLITALKLESLVPALFAVTATCAEAAVSIAGVPFEYWSLALYALIAMTAVALWQRVSAAGR